MQGRCISLTLQPDTLEHLVSLERLELVWNPPLCVSHAVALVRTMAVACVSSTCPCVFFRCPFCNKLSDLHFCTAEHLWGVFPVNNSHEQRQQCHDV